jgi:hypothetical protein
LESEGELAHPASQDDEEFEKELDQMIENINDGEPVPSDIVSFDYKRININYFPYSGAYD